MRHVLSVVVENKPGVLARISGLFSRRGFNIDSLAVGPTEDPAYSRITLVVQGDDMIIEQISKQLYKLIDTYKVIDLTKINHVEREMVLVKVNITSTTRSEVIEIVNIFRAKIIDVSEKTLVIEITGDQSKINGLLKMLKKYGITEMVRTGSIAMQRGLN
ncbi:MAG: acetolactate synthase small subunit [Candidatus Margulisbacteria bacterium GWF2_35_9]|nr:MAG: acetolactate synthase small subunit [Candidatus Margulisbacteria bacterium GWF2_35_9]